MATGVSGYLPSYYQYNAYYENRYGGMYIQPHYVEEWYAEGNYSIIKIDYINFTSSMYGHSVGWSFSGKININGTEYSCGGSFNTANYTATSWPCSIVSNPIYHNSDGSKSITISLTYAYTGSGQVGASWENSGTLSTASVTLTTIPLASTIVATDANIGSVSQLTVTRKSTNYTHTIKYTFGSLSGYVDSSGNAVDSAVKMDTLSIGFTVPTTFYSQIPNAKTGVCTLTITTYSGNTQIGDAKTCTFTVTAAESLCTPSVSGSVVDINEATLALTGSADILVRYMSDALCTISTEAKNSASVSSKTIDGVTVTENARTITEIETNTVKFGVTDSRGYYNSVDVVKSFVPYIKLTNNSTAVRPDPTSGKVTLKIEGSCFNGNFGIKDNAVTAKYYIDGGNPVDATVTMSGNTYSVTLNLTGFNYQSSYSIEVVVSDDLMTVSRTLPIQKGIPVFDWGEDDFNFNVPVNLMDLTIGGKAMWEYVYPVGSIYISGKPESPASLFGGTWERLVDQFLWGTGADANIGQKGGESAHALTVNEMPSHNHGSRYLVGGLANVMFDDGIAIGASGIASISLARARSWSGAAGSASYYVSINATHEHDYNGGSAAHNNMPPYLEVAMWRRTA